MDTETIVLDVTVSIDPDYHMKEGLSVQKIRDTLIWNSPGEPHVGFRFKVRASLGPVALPDAEPVDVGNAEMVDLKTLPVTQNAAGEVFSFAVAAYNAAGNEGPDGLLENVILDFTVPGAPTGLEIVAS